MIRRMPRQCIQQQWLDRVPGVLGTEGAGAIGVDEAGRGPWAGPVFAAAVHVPLDVAIPGVQDSKKMSEKQREEVYRLLTTNHSITYASASVSAKRIDEVNILQATFEAMSAAVKKVRDSLKQKKNVVVLIDGPKVPPAIQAACQTARGTRAEAVIGGDHKMFCIAAASIIAKVERDAYLVKMDAKYPGYGFAAHKGYGTEAHQDALRRLGVCAEHRKSYKPVAAQAARSAP